MNILTSVLQESSFFGFIGENRRIVVGVTAVTVGIVSGVAVKLFFDTGYQKQKEREDDLASKQQELQLLINSCAEAKDRQIKISLEILELVGRINGLNQLLENFEKELNQRTFTLTKEEVFDKFNSLYEEYCEYSKNYFLAEGDLVMQNGSLDPTSITFLVNEKAILESHNAKVDEYFHNFLKAESDLLRIKADMDTGRV
ncbi:MAG: hypothetical protein SNF33_05805 [Candidatus Algichlamydia australiensis]|nr:hypothetical protein [Chlamydiales bacterium]